MIFAQIATGDCQSYLVGYCETSAGAWIDPEIRQIDYYLALAAGDDLRIRYLINPLLTPTIYRRPVNSHTELVVAKSYALIYSNATMRAAAQWINASVHSAFLIGSDKKIKFTMTYPMSAGRNFDESCARLTPSSSTLGKH